MQSSIGIIKLAGRVAGEVRTETDPSFPGRLNITTRFNDISGLPEAIARGQQLSLCNERELLTDLAATLGNLPESSWT